VDPGGDPSPTEVPFGGELSFFYLPHFVFCPGKFLPPKPYVSEGHSVLSHFGHSADVIKTGKGSVDDEPLLNVGIEHVEHHIIDIVVLG